MSDDFATYIQGERDSLTARRRELLNDRNEIDRVLGDIDRSFAAIDAYEAAKTGKAVRAGSTAPRARRGSRREALLHTLADAPLGMSRGELLDAFGVKGDKSGEAAISNVLSALQRAGQVVRQDSGRWTVVAEPLQAAAE